MKRPHRTLFAAWPLVSLAACGQADPLEDPCARASIDPDGTRRAYVLSEVDMPSTAAEAYELGLDLDADEEERHDNALGMALSTAFQFAEEDLDTSARRRLESGELLELIEIQTRSLQTAAGVGVRVLRGLDLDGDPADNDSGREIFGSVEDGAVPLAGTITDGLLDAELGSIPLEIWLPGGEGSSFVELHGARLVAEVSPGRVRGRLGGAIVEEDIDGVLIPMVHQALVAAVARDCSGGSCTPDSFGEVVLEAYDADMDRELSLEEVRENPLTQALLNPDVDLVDARGRLAPGCGDGVKDALSFGVGFTAVPAEIRR